MPALECSFHKWRGFFPPWAPWRGGWWKFEVISWESLKFLSNPNYLVIIGGEGKISIYLEVFEGWFLNRILEQWGWRWNGKNIPFLEQCGNLSCKVLPCRDCVLCVLDDVCREKLENYSDFHFNPQSSLITPAHPREAGSELPGDRTRRQQKCHSYRSQSLILTCNAHKPLLRLIWKPIFTKVSLLILRYNFPGKETQTTSK